MKKLFSLLVFTTIWCQAQIGINTDTPNSKSVLDIVSKDNNKGILMPRLTLAQRDAITGLSTTQDGLTIYNTDEKCYNYYQLKTNEWLSLCGTLAPATYTVNCSSIKTFGTYTQGSSLNPSNYITIPVTVTKAGTYTILAKSTNGYYFEKSGVFPNTGTYTITLDGSGTPTTGPQTDTISMIYDGIVDSTCTSVQIPVKGSQVSYTIACGSAIVNGTYLSQIILDPDSNTITIPLSNVETIGNINITTSSNNGVNFFSTETISSTSNSITLHGLGTPTQVGIYTYTFTTNGANPQTCTFSVNFDTSLGTFENPATRCLEIYNLGKRIDGEYFLKASSGDPFKTFCDMTNGGFTMIRSVSEKKYFDGTSGIMANPALYTSLVSSNFSTAQGSSGTIVYESYQIPLAERLLVRSISGTNNTFRVRIIQEKANVANNNDSWGKNNYALFNFNGNSADFLSGTYLTLYQGFTYSGTTFPDVEVKSKLFGKDYSAPYGYNTITFDGQTFNRTSTWGASLYTGVYNQGSPGGNGFMLVGISHGIATSSGVAAADHPFTYITPNGTVSTNFKYVDQLWGSYYDFTFNHHWGKCTSAAADDYLGVLTCEAGSNANGTSLNTRFPHSFNNGEGRYMQWFVK